ncbi:substrate-binding domain-containing protein [Variovorax sp. PCZ-1]|uniref:LacI family DNA-binding transcriptional regulator n=1 Tax=Variovorax sp. PCZ-1 TaxID=2835533 RepID=UPI001BCF637C|nr:substrate-binding domain-containing protein [Variovorax sp. PCZ-1]MBS7806094.1 substrate-binding domain-containing protein [Variovorax sp. PCZ-1]
MSIQALADSLGISISTVSRALNGYTDVSAATRQRVFDAAKQMNYSPHPVAHRLATGKTGAVAIVNSVRQGNLADSSAIVLHTGVAEVLREHKYFAMSLGIPNDDNELPELHRLLDGRLVDGVVLTRTRTNDPRVSLLQERKIPFVTHGRTLDNAPHAWVDTDNEGAFEQATQALISLGHQRIGLINGMAHMTFAHLRELGFRKALAQAHLDEGACPVHYTELTAESGAHVASQMLALPQRPTALLCATDAVALGAMQAIRQAGLQVGRDVSVMGYGNTEAGQYASPPLASIDHALLDNGKHVAQLLLRLMAGENANQLSVLEMAHPIIRASVGPSVH